MPSTVINSCLESRKDTQERGAVVCVVTYCTLWPKQERLNKYQDPFVVAKVKIYFCVFL